MDFNINAVRAQFPALAKSDSGVPRIFLDNPAGTQVPDSVIQRITAYYCDSNANRGGYFVTAVESDRILDEARAAMAAFMNAKSPDEIVFGPNMTSLTFHITHTLAPLLSPGDEIVVTHMDHDGNVTPWRLLAERTGAVLRWIDFDPETFRYNLDTLDQVIGPRTKIAALNHASNITGTINDLSAIIAKVHAAGGLVYVDSVQFAPHGDVDVQALGSDFLVCSAYKFYGPHAGILWGRQDLLETLKPEKLTASPNSVPRAYELGTQNHEIIAGILGTVEYYADLGRSLGGEALGMREAITLAKGAMRHWEELLAARLIAGLKAIPGVRIQGISANEDLADRVSTVSFTCEGQAPDDVARALGERNIFVWSGHNYALEVIERLGLSGKGGVIRIGPVHYNMPEEIDTVLDALKQILR